MLEGKSADRLDICFVMVKLGTYGERCVIKTGNYGCNRLVFVEEEVDIISVKHDFDRGEV